MTQKLHLSPLEGAPSQEEEFNGRAEELARLGLFPGAPTPAEIARLQTFDLLEFKHRCKQYLEDCRLSNRPSTVKAKRDVLEKFRWFLDSRGYQQVGNREIRAFLTYIKNAHLYPEGRWGRAVTTDAEAARFRKPISARTLEYYFVYLKGFFRWAFDSEFLLRDPCLKIKIDKPHPPCITPFSQDQIKALSLAARRSNFPKRDTAVILFMYDTGLRAAEFCGMTLRDIEFDRRGTGKVQIVGKGGKPRIVPFGKTARIALRAYLSAQPPVPGMNIWISRCGPKAGDALRPDGLRQLYRRLGQTAHISGVRCSPHTMRHSFAINFLRNGGNLPTLQYLMGHSKIETTMRYLHIVDTDAENQHSLYSPADSL